MLAIRSSGWVTERAVSASLVIPSVSAIAVGDFNGDGKLDLAADDGMPQVYFGDGSGKFPIHYNLLLRESWSTAVAAGDFNGDGKSDILSFSYGDDRSWTWFSTIARRL